MDRPGTKGRGLLWAPIALATALLARAALSRVVAKLGHPGAMLDDAYIHFQYARAIAEGHPFRYEAGAAATSGATSLAWPAVLAPFWLLGLRDEAIVWAAWGLSFLALGALAYEAWALTRGLAGDAAAVGAAAMTLAFPAFTWFAASGMEVVPFAWVLARAARRAAEWSETERSARSRRGASELVTLAIVAPLVRPEGAVASCAIAAVLAWFRGGPRVVGSKRALAWALPAAALVGVALPPLLYWAVTGDARSSTAVVKLLPGNPYYRGDALVAMIAQQARFLVGSVLDGGAYSVEFVPAGSASIATAGLVAAALCGVRAGRGARAALVIGLALMMFIPCAYVTFLWNRLRYLWPFTTGWIVGVACLARLAGDVAARVSTRAQLVTPIACGLVAGLFLGKMDGTLDDVTGSASGIDRQQVALGRWAVSTLPENARIGVNDTGAIAYFGGRVTFDIVGLTTRGEAPYWVAGPASRLEHYERLHAHDPGALPTHFIVYPEWFGCDALLGAPLEQATVLDSTILGGQTMRAYAADYDLLGSGEAPWSTRDAVVDSVDVADLESEAAHRYALLDARDGEQVVGYEPVPPEASRMAVDGGRRRRSRESFVARFPGGRGAHLVARVASETPAHVTVIASVAGRTLGTREVEPNGWTEIAFDVPGDLAAGDARVDVAMEGSALATFHYWVTRRE